MTCSDGLSSVDLYNNANNAFEKEDYDLALSMFDECLCCDPEHALAILAYWNLTLTILMKFKFQERRGETVSHEDMKWCKRMLICANRVAIIYESYLKKHPEYGEDYYEIYESAKELYNDFTIYGSIYSNNTGLLSQRSMTDVSNSSIIPLMCLANEDGPLCQYK